MIQGRVVEADDNLIDTDNEELGDVQISILDADNMRTHAETVTDEEGEYEINTSVCSQYQLNFQCEGYMPETLYLSGVNILLQTEYTCDTVELISEEDQGKGSVSGLIKDAATRKGVGNISLYLRRGINNIYTETVASGKTSSDGSYLFENLDAGIYCVEMVDEEHEQYISSYFNIKVIGKREIKGQDGIISSVLSASQIRVVLTWGNMPLDLDSHMLVQLSNDIRGHVYYMAAVLRNRGNKIVCALDIDEINGYGPETITVYSGATGSFQYYVHQYSDEGNLADSGAVVKVYLYGESYAAYVFRVPHHVERQWNVFQYNSATQRIIVD